MGVGVAIEQDVYSSWRSTARSDYLLAPPGENQADMDGLRQRVKLFSRAPEFLAHLRGRRLRNTNKR